MKFLLHTFVVAVILVGCGDDDGSGGGTAGDGPSQCDVQNPPVIVEVVDTQGERVTEGAMLTYAVDGGTPQDLPCAGECLIDEGSGLPVLVQGTVGDCDVSEEVVGMGGSGCSAPGSAMIQIVVDRDECGLSAGATGSGSSGGGGGSGDSTGT